MNGKAFFDTNVLLYLFGSDLRKQSIANALFRRYMEAGDLLLSTQVVQEFYVASRKLDMDRATRREVAGDLLNLPLVVVHSHHIRLALEWEERFQISFWDALILCAAESGGANVLYTEDLNHGQKYGSVTAKNPFI